MLYVDASGNSYFGFDANNSCAIAKYNTSGVQQWVSTLFDGAINWFNALTVDASGNVYATGYKTNQPDMITVKYNSAGVQQWIAAYDCSSYTWCSFNEGTAITIDGSFVYITGYMSGTNIFPPYKKYITIKYDMATGTAQAGWPVIYDAPNNDDVPSSIAVDGSGNVYVTGWTGSATPGQAADDWATISYDGSGNVRAGWPKIYNGPGNNSDVPVQLLLSGTNVVVTGYSTGIGTSWDICTITYDASGNVVAGWPQRYNGPGSSDDAVGNTGNLSSYKPMTIDGSGNIYLCGWSIGSGTGYDFVTIEYNSAGAQQWATRYNSSGSQDDIGRAIFRDAATGNIFVTGAQNWSGNSDYVLLKYNSAGAQQWATTYNGPGNGFDEAAAVYVVGTSIWISGTSAGSGTGPDMCTIKYNDAIMPVELLNFSAEWKNENYVKTFWTTASEKNNDYFAVERSIDGKEFSAAGTVNGAGSSDLVRSYEFTDKFETTSAQTIYYRLKQTDYDGEFTYSQIIAVKNEAEETVSVFVNEYTQAVDFNFISDSFEKISFSVYDILGKQLLAKERIAAKGFTKISVPLSGFSNGSYLASFSARGKTINKKFIINCTH